MSADTVIRRVVHFVNTADVSACALLFFVLVTVTVKRLCEQKLNNNHWPVFSTEKCHNFCCSEHVKAEFHGNHIGLHSLQYMRSDTIYPITAGLE